MPPSQSTTANPPAAKRRGGFALRRLIVALVIVTAVPIVAWILFSTFSFSGEGPGPMPCKVKRGDFVHEITESGNVESGNNVEIRCEVEAKGGGGSTILWIVAEGDKVKGPVVSEKGNINPDGDRDGSQVGVIVAVTDLPPAVEAAAKRHLKPSEIGRVEGDRAQRFVHKVDNGDGQPTYRWQLDDPHREFLITADGKNVRVARAVREPELPKAIRDAVREQLNEKYAKADLTGIRQVTENETLVYRMVADNEMKLEVTPGDIVVELDSSALEKDMINQEIICNQSKANVIQAQNVYDTAVLAKKEYLGEGEIKAKYAGTVKLVRVQLDRSDEGLEEVVTPDAEILVLGPGGRELEKHELPAGAILHAKEQQQVEPGTLLGKLVPGKYDVDEQAIEHEIIDAREGLDRAEDYFQYSTRLESKGYVTALELRADKFAVKKAGNTLASAKARLASLQEFTKKKTAGELDANIKTAEAKLKAEKASHELDLKELRRAEQQVEKCIIRTPRDGQVVYANVSRRHGSDIVIAEGEQVRENQVIIKLPDPKEMQVDCKISEAKVTLVEAGMPVTIQLDAFPEMKLEGEVEMVNELPEPTGFFSSGAKEYKTLVRVDSPPQGLRPGLTAKVNILVEELHDVLLVQAQAIFEHGGKYYCLTEKRGKFQAHEVTIGSTNDSFVVIKEGLKEGQKIVLHSAAYRDEAEGLPEVAEEEETPKQGSPKPESRPQQGVPPKPPGRPPGKEGKPPHGGAAPGGPAEKTPGRPKPGGPGGDPFARFDKNGNGKLEESEVPARFWSMLKTADKDGDAAIDRAEMNAAISKMRQAGGGQGPPGAGQGPPGGGYGAKPGAQP